MLLQKLVLRGRSQQPHKKTVLNMAETNQPLEILTGHIYFEEMRSGQLSPDAWPSTL